MLTEYASCGCDNLLRKWYVGKLNNLLLVTSFHVLVPRARIPVIRDHSKNRYGAMPRSRADVTGCVGT
jgi:hypothetical protein